MVGSVNQKIMATHNRNMALACLRRAGSLSRTQLAHQLDFTQAAITKITGQLLGEGMIREVPLSKEDGGVSARNTLMINPDWGSCLAVSLAGAITVGKVDFSGQLVDQELITEEAYDRSILPELIAVLRRRVDAHSEGTLIGIGVSSGGYVDLDGCIHRHPSLGDAPLPLGAILSEELEAPVVVGEEYRLLLQQQIVRRVGLENEVVVVLALGGAGVGGGHALGVHGRIFAGQNGMAGLPSRRFATVPTPEADCQRLREYLRVVGVETYIEKVRLGDPAVAAYHEMIITNYAWRVAQLANILNPHRIMIYSMLADLGQPFLDAIWQRAHDFGEDVSMANLQVEFGWLRSNAERLTTAAYPLFEAIEFV